VSTDQSSNVAPGKDFASPASFPIPEIYREFSEKVRLKVLKSPLP
jgi:hypothetical protein